MPEVARGAGGSAKVECLVDEFAGRGGHGVFDVPRSTFFVPRSSSGGHDGAARAFRRCRRGGFCRGKICGGQ
jgi:hypothetical protein